MAAMRLGEAVRKATRPPWMLDRGAPFAFGINRIGTYAGPFKKKNGKPLLSGVWDPLLKHTNTDPANPELPVNCILDVLHDRA